MNEEQTRIETYLGRLFGYALSLSGDRDIASDLVQTCVLKALSANNVPVDEPAYRSWLFKILRNSHIDHVRWAGSQVNDAASSGRESQSQGNIAGDSDVFSIEQSVINVFSVREGLSKIGPAHREVLVLIDVAGFTYQEAADLLQVPIGTVMSRVCRARRHLLRLLSDSNVRVLTRTVVGKRK